MYCHHLTYERIGQELASDLVALCTACHDRAHRGAKPSMMEIIYALTPPPAVVEILRREGRHEYLLWQQYTSLTEPARLGSA